MILKTAVEQKTSGFQPLAGVGTGRQEGARRDIFQKFWPKSASSVLSNSTAPQRLEFHLKIGSCW
jgi:hypothetical protein